MIELRTLGAVDLRSSDGRTLQSVLTQPKRLAVLVYLSLASPGGYARRDMLLSLFWPDSSPEQGRNALRQALHFLRRSLGAGALTSRGDDEIGVDSREVWCDAVAFERAVRTGRFAEAADLYHGEFLHGADLVNSPEFEHWVDRQRHRLHSLAQDAFLQLGEQRKQAHDLPGAIEAWRRLVELDPSNKKAVLRLMSILAGAGDRADALTVGAAHTKFLREQFELEPDADVLAFAERLRAWSDTDREEISQPTAPSDPADDRRPVVNAVPVTASLEVGPTAEERTTARSERTAPTGVASSGRPRRTILVWALGIVALLGVGYLTVSALPPNQPGPAAAGALAGSRVAVLPFAVRGPSEYAYLAEGMVDLLSTKLDGAGSVRTADPYAVLGVLARSGKSVLDPERGRSLAAELGAEWYVLGSVVAAGEQLHMTAALYDSRGQLRTKADVVGQSESAVFEMVDRLAAQLLAGHLADSGAQFASAASLTTSSYPALKAYLEGESHFRSQRYPAAIEAFERAVTEDSSFALAHYRLSVVADWAHEYTLAGEAALRAARHKERLSPHYRLLVEGLIAWHLVQPDEAHDIYRTALERYPRDVEGWYRLGEVFFHYNPLRGRPVEEARKPFERVLALDPEHQGALIHLASLAARQRERESLDRYVEQILAESPEDSLEWRALRAFAVGDKSEQDRIVRALRGSSDQELVSAAKEVALNTENLSGAARISRLLIEPTRPPDVRVAGHIFLAHLEVAQGRWSGARRELSEVKILSPAAALAFRALLATVHVLPVPRAEVETIRDALARWGAPAATPNPYISWYSDLGPHLRIYMLGLLSARLEEYATALNYAAQLEQVDESPAAAARGRAMAAAIRARVEFTRGDQTEALAWLDRMRFEESEVLPLPPLGFVGYQRHLRPELLRELGREREALRWYGAVRWISAVRAHSYLELAYLAPWHLRQAEIYDRLGERESALQHYTHFVEMWEKTDPELRDQVTRARRRLTALRGDSGLGK
jgi:DNA-binding SARP family transcriptional activator/TolB-like protein/Tfp pilus assembly protein PilF